MNGKALLCDVLEMALHLEPVLLAVVVLERLLGRLEGQIVQ